jgi:hypothetical protein
MAGCVMVATAPPTPLVCIDGRSKPLSTGDAAAALGISPRTLRAQLLAAPKDAAGSRIVEGEWAGCYRRGLHWRVPAMVVRRRQQTLEARRVITGSIEALQARGGVLCPSCHKCRCAWPCEPQCLCSTRCHECSPAQCWEDERRLPPQEAAS